ncbi:MAG: hypothetical protein ABW154_03190 [Dyella sp.]
MRRLPFAFVLALMPLCAAAQALGDGRPQDVSLTWLNALPPSSVSLLPAGSSVPFWRGTDGRMLSLNAAQQIPSQAISAAAPLAYRPFSAGNVSSSALQYSLSPNVQVQAGLNQRSWANGPLQVLGSEVGASYGNQRYSVGLSLGADSTPNDARLPRIVPGGNAGFASGLPLSSFDSSTQLNARGRLALDAGSGIDLGASVGRVRLLPGNLLGINGVDQKALSFGVDHGSISGTLIGRTLQPDAGIPGAYSPDRRWSSIDLGVTWRLPWQGSLSVGTQNLWTSGSPANTPAGPEPDQSRTPYVQYHQDL